MALGWKARPDGWVAALIGVMSLVMSCGGGPRQLADPSRYAGPLRSRDIERGGQIFRTFCSPCHAGRVSPEQYRWSPAQMRRQIREGNRAMPAIREAYLSDDDMEAVLAFLTVLGAVDAPLPPPAEPAALVEEPAPEAPTVVEGALDGPAVDEAADDETADDEAADDEAADDEAADDEAADDEAAVDDPAAERPAAAEELDDPGASPP